jgi:hypothetical protein
VRSSSIVERAIGSWSCSRGHCSSSSPQCLSQPAPTANGFARTLALAKPTGRNPSPASDQPRDLLILARFRPADVHHGPCPPGCGALQRRRRAPRRGGLGCDRRWVHRRVVRSPHATTVTPAARSSRLPVGQLFTIVTVPRAKGLAERSVRRPEPPPWKVCRSRCWKLRGAGRRHSRATCSPHRHPGVGCRACHLRAWRRGVWSGLAVNLSLGAGEVSRSLQGARRNRLGSCVAASDGFLLPPME